VPVVGAAVRPARHQAQRTGGAHAPEIRTRSNSCPAEASWEPLWRGDTGRSPVLEVIGFGGRPPSPRERPNDPYRLALPSPPEVSQAAAVSGGGPR
jgi:hypothetical protein